MNGYFVAKRPRALWVEDDTYAPEVGPIPNLSVSDHEATDTGLVDKDGEPIMRAPNPIGFVWE